MIFAAAASEWHGSSVWRSPDLGETWQQSSEGLNYGDAELKLSKVSGLTAANGRLFAGAEMPGSVREPRRRRDLVAPDDARGPAGERVVERPRESAAGPPRRAGDPSAPRRSVPVLGDRAGHRHLRDDRRRRVVDAPEPRTARGLAARESRGRLLRPQARDVAGRQRPPLPAEPRRHAPQRRRRRLVDGDHRRAADRVRLRGGRAPARSRHVLRHPARPGPCPLHARRQCGGVAHARRRGRAGSGSTRACHSTTRTSACCAKGWRSTRYDEPGVYFGTSTGQLFASADEGESWSEIASYLPGITSVEVAIVE